MNKPKRKPRKARVLVFSRFFRHWRSGEILDAHAYGHKAWPIGKAS